jgi:polyribonucleotide nucleotidyltransferase
MLKALGEARTELSAHAPRIETISIDKSKIRDVIGTGGKVIREIVATTGAKVDIDDEGMIKISSSDLGRSRPPRLDPGHCGGSRSRQDLQGQGRQHRRFRRS